jgi:hypothetical protein
VEKLFKLFKLEENFVIFQNEFLTNSLRVGGLGTGMRVMFTSVIDKDL